MAQDKAVLEFSEANFGTEVEEPGAGLVLVDFWAPWCAPCRAVAPVIEQLARDFEGRVKIGKLNVDDNQGVAARYGISSIPTIALFKDGEPVDGVLGAAPKQYLASMIEKQLGVAA